MAAVESIESCLAPLIHGNPAGAQSRLARRLKLKPLSAHEGASALSIAIDVAQLNDCGSHVSKAVTIATQVIDSGCFQGAKLEALDPDPLTRALKFKSPLHAGGGTAPAQWAKIALRLAREAAPVADARRNRKLFIGFMKSRSPSALSHALACGALAPLAPADIEGIAKASLEGMRRSSPPDDLEALLMAGLPAPALSSGEALLLLRQACLASAGRRCTQALLDAAAPVLTSSILSLCVEETLKAKNPEARGLGALLKDPRWDPAERAALALSVCRRSIEAKRATPFLSAAAYCEWSPLSARAAQAFGPSFLARVESQAIARATPKAEADALAPAPTRARL